MNGSQPATDLTTVLAGDHRGLDRLCTEIELGQGSPENRKDLADHLIAELVRHSVAEEPYLEADGDLAEAESLMRQLEGAGPQETRFERLLGGLIRAVRRHVQRRGAGRRARRSGSAVPRTGRPSWARRSSTVRDAAPSLPHPGPGRPDAAGRPAVAGAGVRGPGPGGPAARGRFARLRCRGHPVRHRVEWDPPPRS